jgi:hypothetical protein
MSFAMGSPGSAPLSPGRGDSPAMRNGRTLRGLFLLVGLCGLATLGVAGYALKEAYTMLEFMSLFTHMLHPAYAALMYVLIVIAFLSGLLVVLLSTLEAFFSMLSVSQARVLERRLSAGAKGAGLESAAGRNSCKDKYCGSNVQCAYVTILLFITGFIVLQTILASLYLAFLSVSFSAIESVARAQPGAVAMSSLESDINTLQLASFNKCCFEQGWSSQGRIEACPQNGSKPICVLPVQYERFADNLCTCHTSPRYAEFYRAVSSSDACALLSKISVTITNEDVIPGTAIPISAIVPVQSAPIVGFNGTKKENSSATVEYGCGFGGYAKAYQWMGFQMIKLGTQNTVVTLIVIGVIELVLLALVKFVWLDAAEKDYFDRLQGEMLKRAAPGHDADFQLSTQVDDSFDLGGDGGSSKDRGDKRKSNASNKSAGSTSSGNIKPSRHAPPPPRIDLEL